MAAWQCQENLALSYNKVTMPVTAARACPYFKMAWPGLLKVPCLLKVPHLLPHEGLGHPRLHLYKARRTGSTLKEKIPALSWNHISDAPERRQAFMASKALNLFPSKGPGRYFSWDRYQEVCCPSCSSKQGHLWHQTMLLKPSSWQLLKASSSRAHTACLMISSTACLPSWTTNCSLYPVWLSFHLSAVVSHPARRWWESTAPSPPSLHRELDIESLPRLCSSAPSQFLQIFIG